MTDNEQNIQIILIEMETIMDDNFNTRINSRKTKNNS